MLPHLDGLDRHTSVIPLTPGWKPGIDGFPSVSIHFQSLAIDEFHTFVEVGSRVSRITPWLVANALREESVGTADGHIEDEVERLIERRV